MSEEYDLGKSEKSIGQLYPILVAKDGEVIDGLHRETADQNWKRITLSHIDTQEKKLIVRCVSNWHRREVPREEKAEWINGLAKIYKNQGLRIFVKYPGISQPQNEISQKLMEVTGLTTSTIRTYLDKKYKQPEEEGVGRPAMPIIEKAESTLGREGLKKLRKQVLEEAKLSPQERAALTKKRHQEKEERKRKREENKLKEEEKRKQREEQIWKQAEKSTKEKLLQDKDFIRGAAKIAPLIKDVEVKVDLAPTPELREKIVQAMKEEQEHAEELVKDPKVRERGRWYANWLAHGSIVNALTTSAFCPICGVGAENIGWLCHDLKLTEAYKKTTEEYQKRVS